MSKHLTRELVSGSAHVHETLRQPMVVDRTFGLPRVLYGMTVALYLGFLAVTAVSFSSPGLIIPMAVIAFFVVVGFGIPAIWTRMKPDHPVKALSWQRFRREEVATLTGRLGAGEAAAQLLVLPVLIFLWGIATVTIAALVR